MPSKYKIKLIFTFDQMSRTRLSIQILNFEEDILELINFEQLPVYSPQFLELSKSGALIEVDNKRIEFLDNIKMENDEAKKSFLLKINFDTGNQSFKKAKY